MVASDDVFNSIGVTENATRYYCCDDQAFDVGVFRRREFAESPVRQSQQTVVYQPAEQELQCEGARFHVAME